MSLFGSDSNIAEVESFDAALRKLRAKKYDLLVVEDSDFLASQRAAMAEQSSVILETIGQGVGILDLSGSLVWGNHLLEGLSAEQLADLSARCLEVFSDQIASGRSERVNRRFSLLSAEGAYFEVTASPVVDGNDKFIQIAVVLWDATSSRQMRQKIDAIDNAGRELVRLGDEQISKLDIPSRLELLEDTIIRRTREILGYDKFCVRLLDKKSNRLELVLSAGLDAKAKSLDIFVSPEENGISGYVASTGRSYICPDVGRDRRYLYGIENAGSSLTVPLFLQDHVVGVFNIESEQIGAFSEDDRQFAEIFGRYVALAMNILDLLVVERYQATGQVADNVAAEISGPLKDIFSEASALMAEYIGRDDLCAKLQSICNSVGSIREVVKQVGQGANGLLDGRRTKPAKDPVLCDKTVLVVDDEPIILETINDILTDSGARVDIASNGTEAVEMVTAKRYDVILSDIKMPGKNGYEIFAAAKDVDEAVPVVFMTGFGYDPHHSVIRARQEGLAGVLYKPFKVSEFLSLIKDVIREASR